MVRLYWDYYGGRAAGTAQHFQVHLIDFIEKLNLDGCSTGTEAYTPTHHSAWCDAPESHCDILIQRLKAHRREAQNPTSTSNDAE